jgi:hypothetical protein
MVKWGGLAVFVVIAMVWVWSGWYWIPVARGRTWMGGIVAGCGRVQYVSDIDFRRQYWSVDRLQESVKNGRTPLIYRPAPFAAEFLPYWDRRARRGPGTSVWWVLHIPLWPLAILVLGAAMVAWRLDTLARRRAKLDACPKCSYSRTGLVPSAVCPECGSPASNATPAAR